MIYVQDVFTLLATGEFSNLSLGVTSTGSIKETEYDKIVGAMNLGITEIYKRFRFLQDELTLHIDPDVEKYYLQDDKRAVLGDISSSLYIEVEVVDDTTLINIIEVMGLLDEDGEQLKVNNRFATPSIIQLSPTTLKITGVDTATTMTVLYQAIPPKIVLDEDFDPATQVVSIAEVTLDALLYYIATRIYKPTGSNDSTANSDKSQMYQQQYELACQKLQMYGLDANDDDEENTFESDGWA